MVGVVLVVDDCSLRLSLFVLSCLLIPYHPFFSPFFFPIFYLPPWTCTLISPSSAPHLNRWTNMRLQVYKTVSPHVFHLKGTPLCVVRSSNLGNGTRVSVCGWFISVTTYLFFFLSFFFSCLIATKEAPGQLPVMCNLHLHLQPACTYHQPRTYIHTYAHLPPSLTLSYPTPYPAQPASGIGS